MSNILSLRSENMISPPLIRSIKRLRRVLPERNMGPHLVIIGGALHKDSSKMLRV
jgi:hypothetical protein